MSKQVFIGFLTNDSVDLRGLDGAAIEHGVSGADMDGGAPRFAVVFADAGTEALLAAGDASVRYGADQALPILLVGGDDTHPSFGHVDTWIRGFDVDSVADGTWAGAAPQLPTVGVTITDSSRLALYGDIHVAQEAEGVVDLLNEFVRTAAPQMGEIQSAVDAADAKKVEFAAHYFKGACAALGAVALQNLCQDLVNQGRSADLSDSGASAALAWIATGASVAQYNRVIAICDETLRSAGS